MWWSRIGDIMVVSHLPEYRKQKLECSFDCFLSLHYLSLLIDSGAPRARSTIVKKIW